MFGLRSKVWTWPVVCGFIAITSGCSLFHKDSDSLAAGSSGQERTFTLEQLSPENVVKSVKNVSGFGPDERIARALFAEGDAEFRSAAAAAGKERRGQYLNAAAKYAKAVVRWPESALEEDALYMQAESLFFADRYDDAVKAHGELIKNYPNTRHFDVIDARRFSLAKYWIDQHQADPEWILTPNFTDNERPLFDTHGNAVRVFDRIRLDDPTGKLADDATMAAANAYFKEGKYVQADALYSDTRESFPNSEHQFQAHMLGLKCKLLTYQGPQYDGTGLDEAELLIKQIRRQFPEESRAQQEYLKRAFQEVRMNKALREWEMASYFDRRHEYGAARQYYEIVKKDFADTSLAQKSEQRLAEITDRPDKPPQYLSWLVNLFPTDEENQPLLNASPLETLRR